MYDTMAEGGWAASLRDYVVNNPMLHAEDQGNIVVVSKAVFIQSVFVPCTRRATVAVGTTTSHSSTVSNKHCPMDV